MDNFYRILDIPEDAEGHDIKKAFRKLAKQYHPDKPGGDSEKFRKISHAYKILSNPASRLDYDKTLSNFKKQQGSVGDYVRHVHSVKGSHLKKMVKEMLNQGHLTGITIRYKGKKLFELSFPMAAGFMVVGAIKAPIALLLLNLGLASFFEIEVTNQSITLYNEALSLHESGKLIDAERIYKTILKKSEYFIPALMNLGLLYRQQGKNQDAVRIFEKILEIAPFGEIGEMAGKNLNELRGF